MRNLIFGAVVLIAIIPATFLTAGAERTWTGRISDSACRAKHVASEGEPPPVADECTAACIRGGSKYVLVTESGETYKITNQSHPDLAKHAGKSVKVTGELADDSIAVAKLEVAANN